MIVLFQYRNAAATCCDNDLVCVKKRVDCVKFHDFYRVWCRDNTTESPAGFLDDIVPFSALFVCLLGVHITSKDFRGGVERIVIRIDDHLSQDSADSAVDTAV